MRRRLLVLVSLFMLGGALLIPLPVGAALDPFSELCAEAPQAEACQGKDKQQDVKTNAIYGTGGVIPRVTGLISLVVGIGSVLVIIIAGLQYILSTGDPAKTAKSKNAILFAIVGLTLALLAPKIVMLILNSL